MLLNVIIDDQSTKLNIPPALLNEAQNFFDRMDRDMDAGWQIGRQWVELPNRHQRCQIVADKLLTAMENENRQLAMMTAGYLLSRMPDIQTVDIDTSGEVLGTQFIERASRTEAETRSSGSTVYSTMAKAKALEQAGNDVTNVFKVGPHYGFSVFNPASGQWQDSPPVSDKAEAEALRQQAYNNRYIELIGDSTE